MASGQSLQIELNPAYLADTRERYGDVEAAIRDAVGWVITHVLIARSMDELREAFARVETTESVLRAFVGCELLGQASSRPDVQGWLCEYLDEVSLEDGARYQLAGVYSRLGAVARRANRLAEAVSLAKRGIEAVTDLPSSAVTANLYYNLGIALERSGALAAAIEAFDDSAEIDDLIGRYGEATLTRQRVALLTPTSARK